MPDPELPPDPDALPVPASPEQADASWLLERVPSEPASVPSPAGDEPPGAGGGYEVGEIRTARPAIAPAPVPDDIPPPPLPSSPARPRKRDEDGKADDAGGEAYLVDPAWSRWGEWSADLPRALGALLATLVIALIATTQLSLAMGLSTFLAGILATIALAYPVLITLERPVRLTPEQAVRYYFEAASHARPHYRRMWLLMSNRGRAEPCFGTFERFAAFWEAELERRRGRAERRLADWLHPVAFEVQSFEAPRSQGEEHLRATFVLTTRARGAAGEAQETHVLRDISLSRGPDRMWYLDDGRPES